MIFPLPVPSHFYQEIAIPSIPGNASSGRQDPTPPTQNHHYAELPRLSSLSSPLPPRSSALHGPPTSSSCPPSTLSKYFRIRICPS